ncbi:zeta toxin family protein [Patescibacteria group bacterium]|nr:zeta toxin family protein [Patescibacteria group bacterium]
MYGEDYIKKNKKEIIEKFASLLKYSSVKNPFTVLMAGSPGAGKTEFSKSFIISLSKNNNSKYRKIVRIDADDIKNIIPGYNGKNTKKFHKASIIGLEILFNSVLKNKQDVLIDGTLCNYNKACENINRSLKRNRKVSIFYIYQDPLIAWEFVKKRKKIEGRVIPKKIFIEDFFKARNNVNKLKKDFGNKIYLNLVIKDLNKVEKYKIKRNINNVDNYLKIKYSKKELVLKLC